MPTPIFLTPKAANLMIEIATALRNVPAGTPCKIKDGGAAKELERAGLIDRVHVGAATGAVQTPLGEQFVKDAIRHLTN